MNTERSGKEKQAVKENSKIKKTAESSSQPGNGSVYESAKLCSSPFQEEPKKKEKTSEKRSRESPGIACDAVRQINQ